MSNKNNTQTREENTYNKLVDSSLYQTYKQAFIDATGMNLALIPADEEFQPADTEAGYRNRFCESLNSGISGCEACVLAGQCLKARSADHAETTTCFAGMCETLIPIKGANQTIAFLSTGQVFADRPSKKEFKKVATELTHAGLDEDQLSELESVWQDTSVMSGEQYQGTVTLLAAFALQLTDLLNRLMIEEANSEPEIVTRAKQYVCANLEDKVNLEDVANKVGVSTFYFCKVFKASTGMTLTEYVNRRRVEWAKRKLLNPQVRITEVAYDVGYQSLSQFNRSFQKYVGASPSQYREQQSSAKVSATQLVAA